LQEDNRLAPLARTTGSHSTTTRSHKQDAKAQDAMLQLG
jgi:hypothetical protein